MGDGWIKLHRVLRAKGYYRKSAYVHLWVHLLISAVHSPQEFFGDGGVIKLQAGQFFTGRKQLSRETGIAETTIERILETLENEHQIGQQTSTKYRIITILNWSKWQKADSTSDSKRTASGQQADTYKNDKKVKNDKKDSLTSSVDDGFQAFWKTYPRKIGKTAALRVWSKLKPSVELAAVITQSVTNHMNDPQWREMRYVPHPATYLNQGRWEDEVQTSQNTYKVTKI